MSTPSEELSVYLAQIADKLQSKLEQSTADINKKLDEVTNRIDSLDKSRRQMEEATHHDPIKNNST